MGRGRVTGGGERGIALVVVLWVITLLTVIAASFAFAMRTETVLGANMVAQAKGRALAQAAMRYALLGLLQPDDPPKWFADGTVRRWDFAGGAARIAVFDQAGKIDLNSADHNLLLGLFNTVGVPTEEGEALADAIEDWRDKDQARRLNGAEDEEYEDAELPYGAKDGPFETIEELQQVMGMTAERYERVKDLITVYSRVNGVNPEAASEAVLRAVPGVDAELLADYIQQRQELRESGEPAPPAPGMGRYASRVHGSTYEIRVAATVSGATVSVAAFLNLRRGGASEPFTIMAWKEGIGAWAEPQTNEHEEVSSRG
jgi:general secretion pathway protein K